MNVGATPEHQVDPAERLGWIGFIGAGAVIISVLLFAVPFGFTKELSTAELVESAERALETKQFAAAVVHYRHLLARQPDEPKHAHGMALALNGQRNRAEAMRVLRLVAAPGQAGYVPAHLQQARWVIEERMMRGTTNAASWGECREHLRLVLAQMPEHREASELFQLMNDMAGGQHENAD